MGNRVKGKVKQKSVKAALGASAGSKRKLTRMGKKQKKEHSGLEATFMGRSRALRVLQVTLKDFRRLCILKGIYPREPLGRVPGKKKGQSFYHVKDIRAIAHEPILEKFREFRSFMKKVRRAAGRNEPDEAVRKNSLVPTYTLHHLVKERYPRFVDAVSDIDDALTLAYLFAALPGEGDIKSVVTNKAKSLVASWGAYCATTSSITKSFISVKGVYLEATIQNIPVRWIVPHSFTQHLPDDVDYRIMMTFFEFYETLLNFVLFKLYNGVGVRYPFNLQQLGGTDGVAGSTAAVLGANLLALTNALKSSKDGAVSKVVSAMVQQETQKKGKKNASSSSKSVGDKKKKERMESVDAALKTLSDSDDDDDNDDDDDDDSVDVAGPLQAALQSIAEEEAQASVPGGAAAALDDDCVKRKRLFAGLTFFLSREVPRGYLELVCLAYGGKVGWEGGEDSPISAKDPSITHHIVDRPRLPASYESLPKSREYVQPQWILDCANFTFLLPTARYAVGAALPPHLSPWVDDEEEGYKPAYAEEIERLKNGEIVDFEEEVEVDVAAVAAMAKRSGRENSASEDEEGSGDESEKSDGGAEEEAEDEEEDEETTQKRRERQQKKEEAEAHALAKTMMSRKATHLYGRMQHGLAQKQAKTEVLHQRRKEIDSTKEKNPSGKTILKLKVERLKEERRTIEASYSNTGGSMKKNNKKRRTESK